MQHAATRLFLGILSCLAKMKGKGESVPAYEYLCEECSCHFEKRQKMSDAVIEQCPECGGRVKRLISGGAGAITKGVSQQVAPAPCASGSCCGGGMCGFSEN
jgi:putative FmdB family regulatory protein